DPTRADLISGYSYANCNLQPVMSTQRDSTKCPLACQYCRVKKAKCNGAKPCANCVVCLSLPLLRYQGSHSAQAHNEVCTYPAIQSGSRKRKEREADMEDRLHRLELLLRATAETQTHNQTQTQSQSQTNGEGQNQNPSAPYTAIPTSQESLQLRPLKASRLESVNNKSPHAGSAVNTAPDGSTAPSPHTQGNEGNCEHAPPLPQGTVLSQSKQEGSYDRILAVECDVSKVATSNQPPAPPAREAMQASVAADSDVFDSNPREDNTTSEQPGCTPYLAMCSVAAVEWVAKQVDSSERDVGESPLSTDVILRGEYLNRPSKHVRAAEPEFETAMRWTNGRNPFDNPIKFHETPESDCDTL
ncbi:hypothetical protein V491_08938, partial [Pseudogymnoascus sp. VKM F-3775]